MGKRDIQSMRLPQLAAFMEEWGEPAFRAGQVFQWLHRKQASSFAEMTNLALTLREKMEQNCYINSINIEKRLVSGIDGTVKYLYGLTDGNCVESVLMSYRHGHSLCISTQVGCRMGCRFCASTIGGVRRGLAASEMLGQVYRSGRDAGVRIGSVVLMGIGEPLDNYENVLAFLQILSHPKGMGMSLRHVSLSTCGMVDGIRRLAEENLPLTLSVSLHAPNDEIRGALMPVNRRWPMEELLAACGDYFAATGRRISFEYALIDGVNDRTEHAAELASRLKGQNCHVNLIPVNAVEEKSYRRSKARSVSDFRQELEKRGVTATVRRELGSDIHAACGQLRRQEQAGNAGPDTFDTIETV